MSPVNTQVCPDIRKLLLGYLGDMTEQNLGGEHPIAVLARHLLASGDDKEIFERAIAVLQGLLVSRLGYLHPMCIKAQISSIRMVRRNQEYESARHSACAFYQTMQIQFGNQSLHARKAAREFEHVLIDMREYEEALDICFSIIGANGGNVQQSTAFEEYEATVYTMEDIAKIYHELGDGAKSELWLKRAATVATRLFHRDDISLQHIQDKLDVLRLGG